MLTPWSVFILRPTLASSFSEFRCVPLKLPGMLSPAPGRGPTPPTLGLQAEAVAGLMGCLGPPYSQTPSKGGVGPFRAQMQCCPFLSHEQP